MDTRPHMLSTLNTVFIYEACLQLINTGMCLYDAYTFAYIHTYFINDSIELKKYRSWVSMISLFLYVVLTVLFYFDLTLTHSLSVILDFNKTRTEQKTGREEKEG